MTIAHIDGSGKVLAKRTIACFGFGLRRPVTRTASVKLIAYPSKDQDRLFTLDEHLHDQGDPIPMNSVGIDNGAGFELSDKTLLLFGTVPKGGGDPFTKPVGAAVARAAPNGVSAKPHL